MRSHQHAAEGTASALHSICALRGGAQVAEQRAEAAQAAGLLQQTRAQHAEQLQALEKEHAATLDSQRQHHAGVSSSSRPTGWGV
eukprot:SAG25_NODE_118_length_14760_cov_873.663666_26_plen_85_part_00